MRNRIVVWGRNAQEERVLIALELLVEQNIVKIQTFTEKDVTDDVYKIFMDQWRKNAEAEIPEPKKVWARELSVSDDLLPEELKVERDGDMITRAQTEWHYMVLSEKLKQAYNAELAEINDRVERADSYDSNLWGQLKTFWEKVQTQLRDKTLLREHGNDIRKDVDKLFTQLKGLRDKLNEEVKEKSAETVKEFAGKLEQLEKRIEEGTHLRKVFDDLRKLQSKFHNSVFSRDDRKVVYDRIDKAFKAVKSKRNQGGGDNQAGGAMARLKARFDGLLKAIEKMERSIGRDEKDLQFEHRRIARTDGQLEAQIRQAKIKMIESRVSSKREKLDDMNKTKTMLIERMEKQQKRLEKEQKRQAERAAAEAAKAKIAEDIKSNTTEISPAEKAKLEAAANAIKEGKQQRKGKAASEGQPLVENAIAISEIVAGKGTGEDTNTSETAETKGKTLFQQAGELIADVEEKLEDVVEDAVDTVKAVAQVAGEKISDVVDEIKEEVKEMTSEEE